MNIVVCGNYGAQNIGDQAILMGMRVLLNKVFPGAHIEVMGKGRLLPLGIRSIAHRNVIHRIFSTYRLLKECDLFVLGGGGLFTDEEGPFVSTFWALHGLFAKLLNKKLAILGVSIGGLLFFNKPLVQFLFKKADIVMVRDRYSHEVLKKWKIENILGTDLAFFLNPPIHKKVTKVDKYIVVSIRPYHKNDDLMYKKIAQLCDYIVRIFALNIRFLPMSDSPQNDSIILNKIFDHMEYNQRAKVLPFSEDVDKVISLIASSECIIGMRLHACILASICAVPFIPLSYMKKVEHFWSQAKTIETLDIYKSTLDEMIKEFEKNFNGERQHTAINNHYNISNNLSSIINTLANISIKSF